MKLEPGRAAIAAGQRDGHDRLAAMRAFERALEDEGPPGDDRSGDHPGDQDGGGNGSGRQTPPAMELGVLDMSPQLLRLMNQSLMGSLGQGTWGSAARLLEGLLADVTGGLRACKQVSGQDWRLSLRIDPVLLAQTVLQMSCRHGHLAVSIRTACGAAHQKLLEVLPELNLALQRHGLPERLAEVLLVNPGELA